MWRHGCHAAGVRCVRDAGHDGHDLGYLLLQVLYLLVLLQDLTWESERESVERLPEAELFMHHPRRGASSSLELGSTLKPKK